MSVLAPRQPRLRDEPPIAPLLSACSTTPRTRRRTEIRRASITTALDTSARDIVLSHRSILLSRRCVVSGADDCGQKLPCLLAG